MVWSDDSKYLAVPHWMLDRSQRLLVLNPRSLLIGYLPGLFHVLELPSFERGVIRAVDSPANEPASVECC